MSMQLDSGPVPRQGTPPQTGLDLQHYYDACLHCVLILARDLCPNTMSDAQDGPPERRQKRARHSVREAIGKVSWDDIELGSSEDEALPATKKGRPAAPQSRRDRVRDTCPPPLQMHPAGQGCVAPTSLAAELVSILQVPVPAHEMQLDMETAWAVGFNAMSLTEEEENLLPPGADEAIYCQVEQHCHKYTHPIAVEPRTTDMRCLKALHDDGVLAHADA